MILYLKIVDWVVDVLTNFALQAATSRRLFPVTSLISYVLQELVKSMTRQENGVLVS
jgi:hypothetical protein